VFALAALGLGAAAQAEKPLGDEQVGDEATLIGTRAVSRLSDGD
jgi:hypothetical protein